MHLRQDHAADLLGRKLLRLALEHHCVRAKKACNKAGERKACMLLILSTPGNASSSE